MVPASSTPVGPAPMMTKVRSAARLLRIGLALGALERDQNAPPQRGGVLERFQSRRERLPFVMAEIGVARAGGEHQRVVRHRVAVVEQHGMAVGIDSGDCGKQRRHLLASTQQMANRPGDFGRGERGGRDLIEQRLEQMMVAAVDQGDLHRRTGKPEGALQPTETGADDHHAMRLFRRAHYGMRPRLNCLHASDYVVICAPGPRRVG